MRNYWLLAVIAVAQAAPRSFPYDITPKTLANSSKRAVILSEAWQNHKSATSDESLRSTFVSLVDWCRRSLEPVLQLVIEWLPSIETGFNLNDGKGHDGIEDQQPSDFFIGHDACTEPSVRREWRTMSADEKEAWIEAVLCLTNLPGSGYLDPTVRPTDPLNRNPPVNHSGSWYDDLSYVHMDLNTHVHQTGFFFPWHRYYLWSFEQTLKQQCGYTGVSPYWDWTQDAHNFKLSNIFYESDPTTGLGSFGDPSDDYVVRDGAFAGMQLAYPSPHILRRQYTPYPYRNRSHLFFQDQNLPAASTFTPDKMKKVPRNYRGDFKAFQTYLEHMQGPHMSVHFIMGGDLGGTCPKNAPHDCTGDAKWSPNEPMFWLHHGMLDKLWYDWQLAHPENFWAFEAGTVRELATWPKYPNGAPPAMTPAFRLPRNGILIGNYTVRDMFNTTSNVPLCYKYI